MADRCRSLAARPTSCGARVCWRRVLERGEKIELLVDKAENLNQQAARHARRRRRHAAMLPPPRARHRVHRGMLACARTHGGHRRLATMPTRGVHPATRRGACARAQAFKFRKQSSALKRAMWLKNLKLYALVAFILGVRRRRAARAAARCMPIMCGARHEACELHGFVDHPKSAPTASAPSQRVRARAAPVGGGAHHRSRFARRR